MTIPFNFDNLTSLIQELEGGGTGTSPINTPVPSPTPTVTPIPTDPGIRTQNLCQGDGECPTGFICDSSNPLFINDDLTNPYGICISSPLITPTPTIDCPPFGTFLGCTGVQTPSGGIAEFSAGVINGVCGYYTGIDTRCNTEQTPTVTPSPTITPTPTVSFAACETYLGPPRRGFKWDGQVVLQSGLDPDTNNCREILIPDDIGVQCGDTFCSVGFICKENFCVDPNNDPCANNGPCGNKATCTYGFRVGGGLGPVCIPNENRRYYILCGTGEIVEGDPPSSLIKSQDYLGRECYGSVERFRICETNVQLSSRPQDLELSNDSIGPCYREAPRWRRCETNVFVSGEVPSNLGVSSDSLGICYDTVWVACSNRNFNNRGVPPLNYVFDAQSNCWNPPISIDRFTDRKTCSCYTVVSGRGPDGENLTAQVTFLACNNSQNETVASFGTNTFCVRNDIISVINGSATKGSDCTQSGICFVEPTSTPTITPPPPPTETIIPTATPTFTVSATQTITQTVIPTPTPTPTPTWRDCVTGNINEGIPPASFIQLLYRGAGGGTCWEPVSVVGFEPSLQEALTFLYRRGTPEYPGAKAIKVTNPSFAKYYKITLKTNDLIGFAVGTTESKGTINFELAPREQKIFSINITPELLNILGDGGSTMSMTVELEEL